MIKHKILWCGDIKTNENVKYGRQEGEEEEKIELWRGGGEGGKERQLKCIYHQITPLFQFFILHLR